MPKRQILERVRTPEFPLEFLTSDGKGMDEIGKGWVLSIFAVLTLKMVRGNLVTVVPDGLFEFRTLLLGGRSFELCLEIRLERLLRRGCII